MVISFPDVYEIAASNPGHQLIQHVINSRDEFLAERVYAVWPDMEERLRETGTPLYSLESFHPVSDFDVLGVSLSHELSYTNFLQILDLAGLPLQAEHRGFPLVVAGGPAVFNPEPIARFVDAFFLGDGETGALELVEVIAEHRNEIDRAGKDPAREKELKARILARWGGAGGEAGIRGVYVPSHFEVHQERDGRITGIENIAGGPDVIQKALVTDLDGSPWVLDPPLPHMQGVTNRVTVEPARGCTRGCRFCQAGMIYRPYRMRSVDLLVEQAEHLLASTGLQEQSFLALSTTDWPGLRDFLDRMLAPERDFHLRISLPSNRVGAIDQQLTNRLSSNRKGGLTLAIESATARLRAVVNKPIEEAEIDRAVESALGAGWDLIKLYFIIGLPTETDEDVLAIMPLVERLRDLHRRLRKEGATDVGRLRIRVSVSNFVPKAHTPFQWASMGTAEELDRKQRMLLGLRKMRAVDLSTHDIDSSRLEGVMARGDRRLADVIERAFRLGVRFDAWGDRSDPGKWMRAFEEIGLDPEWYHRERDAAEILPWDHLSCGVDKDWLRKEWEWAFQGKTTPDCNETVCLHCGLERLYPECRPRRL